MAEGSYKGMDREYVTRTRINYGGKWHARGVTLVMPLHDAKKFIMANAIEPVSRETSMDDSPPTDNDDVH